MKKTLLTLLAALTAGMTATAAQASRYEEAAWTLVETRGALDIRQYPDTVQARTVVRSEQRAEMSSGFRVLANYIFGGNAEQESIAMTVPVTTSAVDEGQRMTFTMPSAYGLEDLPSPIDDRVEVVLVPGGTFAVYRFRGRVDAEKAESMREKALEHVRAEGLEPIGAALVAQYNGPWTPGPLRRNEVLVPIR